MTIPEYEKLTPYERALLEELQKIRKAIEALKED